MARRRVEAQHGASATGCGMLRRKNSPVSWVESDGQGVADAGRVRHSLSALHVLPGYGDDHRIRPPVEFHGRDYDHGRVVGVVVHADALVPKVGDADAARCAPLAGNLAVDRVVGQIAVLVGARQVFAKARLRSADASHVRDGARLFRRPASA